MGCITPLDELDDALLADELLLLDALLLDEPPLLDEALDALDELLDDVLPLEVVLPLDVEEPVSPLEDDDEPLGLSPRLTVPSSSKTQAVTNDPPARANAAMVKMRNERE